ncbi:MAG TPA: SDR family oxidoreductase [Dongiaceae bacterium]|nr:SDR family oxidoreductase [Dongiaceae bacterium]
MTRTVLITGCSSGIGAATARLFAAEGWNVVATARRPAAMEPLAVYPQVLRLALDVQDEAGIAASVAAGIERFGQIDLLVNNAGFSLFGLFEGTSPAKIREQFDVNLFGVMAVTRAILPHFRRNKAGLIINVSSGAGLFTLPLLSMYCASKFALEGFTEALAYELAAQNIGIKLIEPHGGVSSTAFGARVTEEVKAQAADSGIDAGALHLADYDRFVTATHAAFDEMRAQRMMSADDVAAVILAAATDGTDRLRYPVGDDARGFVKARREKTDQDYVDFMRARFRPKG